MTDRSKRSIYTGAWTSADQELSSECRLWRQVISQAISDAYLEDMKPKLEVIQWIDTEDFETVCDCAAVNAERMRQHFVDILESKPAIARYKGRKLKDVLVNY